MTPGHDELEKLALDVDTTSHALRRALLDNQRAIVQTASLVAAGELGVEALRQVDAARHRQRVTDCLDEYEVSRHRFRIAMFRVCLDEGASMSEIGRLLSISRQLASRLASEARAEGP